MTSPGSKYRVELSNQAERVLRRLAVREQALYERISNVLDDLSRDPFQGKPLKGELRSRYAYRVGVYRILYRVEHHQLLVSVIDIGHRREIYR